MSPEPPLEWPRARQWDFGPLTIFRNPDAGVWLEVAGFRFGPGQCGERTWNRRTNDVWCYRPFDHAGPHAYDVPSALAAASR